MSNIENVLTNLSEREVTVEFTKKKDGLLRTMRCTTNPKMIPVEKHPKTTSEIKAGLYKVFDLDLNEWRSFNLETVIRAWAFE